MVFISPIHDPYKVTAAFGIQYLYGKHAGTDLVSMDTPRNRILLAPADGTITSVKKGAMYSTKVTPKGQRITIDHGNGYVSEFAHMDDIFVTKGQSVRQGQEVGVYGFTGFATTGPHLHWEVRHAGVLVDAMEYIGEPINNSFMETFDVAIERSYWEILGRSILDREREALLKSDRSKAAFDRHTSNLWTSKERKERIEDAYAKLVRKKNQYMDEYITFQVVHKTPFERILLDLLENRAEYKKKA